MKNLNIKEEDLLVARDYVLENYYNGDIPTDFKEICILNKVSQKTMSKLLVISPIKRGWIKINDGKKRVTNKTCKIIFDLEFLNRIFDFLDLNKSYIITKIKLIKYCRKQDSPNKLRGMQLIKFYLKLNNKNKIDCRSMYDYHIKNITYDIIEDLAAYFNLTKMQLINMIE